MKKYKLYTGIITVLLTAMLTGCSDNIPDNITSPTEANEAEEGYYTANFNVSIPSFEQQVTRSTLFTNEGIGKNCVKLFCFDEEGQFVGFGKVGEFGEIKGGYIGKSFSIPQMATDGTNELTVKVFELSGSPIREILHTWINGTVDLDSGLAHYNGLIASGEIGYAQANHTAEFIYVMTDRTGMKVEYACHLTNCFPTQIPSDHFNGESGNHEVVQYDVVFNCTKHEGIDVNEKAKLLLKNNQIMTNSIEYFTGLNVSDITKSIFQLLLAHSKFSKILFKSDAISIEKFVFKITSSLKALCGILFFSSAKMPLPYAPFNDFVCISVQTVSFVGLPP